MSTPLPSLNALRAFEAVARHLSYRNAANELNVTPAAVKQLVAKLEDALETPLVKRRGRGLRLTAAGEVGRESLSQGFAQIADSVAKMRGVDKRRRLIVSVEPSFAAAWLVPRMEKFRTNNRDVEVLIDSSLEIVELKRGAADIALRFGAHHDDGLVVHRLFDEELCAFCSPSVAVNLRTLDDLNNATLLHWDLTAVDWAPATRKWMDWSQWLTLVGAEHVTMGEGLRFSDYNLAVQAAVAGQGVILGSWPILRTLVDADILASPFSKRLVTDIGYDLVTTEGIRDRPDVACFVDWILEEAC